MVFGLTMYFRFHYPCMPPTMVILATHLSSLLYSCHHHQPLTHAIAPLPNSDHKGIHILVCLALALLTSCCTSSFLKWTSSKLYDSIMVLILHKTAVFLHWAIHNPVADPGGFHGFTEASGLSTLLLLSGGLLHCILQWAVGLRWATVYS